MAQPTSLTWKQMDGAPPLSIEYDFPDVLGFADCDQTPFVGPAVPTQPNEGASAPLGVYRPINGPSTLLDTAQPLDFLPSTQTDILSLNT